MKHQVFDLAEYERGREEKRRAKLNAQQAAAQRTAVTASSEAQANDVADNGVNSSNIKEAVSNAMKNYFEHLDGQEAFDIYEMVLAEVEEPLLQAVMQNTRKNQTKAATMLGLNRGTLRKKLKQYGML